MRATDCRCRQRLVAHDDSELFLVVRDHVDQVHPDLQLSDDLIRQMLAVGSYRLHWPVHQRPVSGRVNG